jgi:hypothetical protein
VSPAPSFINAAAIPETLRAHDRWVLWKFEERDGRATKVPYRDLAFYASSNNPATWRPFNFVYQTATASDSAVDGIGFMLLEPFVGIDLDDCVDESGTIAPWAQAVIAEVGSYTERSPSGRGIRIVALGAISASAKINGCEIYGPTLVDGAVKRGRFVTITGQHIAGTSHDVRPCAALEALRARIAENRVNPNAPVTRHLHLAASTSNGSIPVYRSADFDKLYRGDTDYITERYGGDQSAADLALATVLAARLHGDRDAIEAAFDSSALGQRDKWRGREDYRARTIDKAIHSWRLQPNHDAQAAAADASAEIDADTWRSLFHTYEDFLSVPPLKFAIRGFLQEDGVTYLGGLPGHGKTLVMLSMVKSLLEGTPLFGHPDFVVDAPARRVLYLIPEAGIRAFKRRLEMFRLLPHVAAKRLFVRTLSAEQHVTLSDPRILRAADGADVFLDTAIRFMEGDENSAADHKKFAATLFALQRAGARTIVGAHHSPKVFGEKDVVTLESALRGSGDTGAMVTACWALKQTNADDNTIYVANVKARDFDAVCAPFEITGRPHIDQTGNFAVSTAPGIARSPRGKPKKDDPRKATILRMIAAGVPAAEIIKAVGVSQSTFYRLKHAHLSEPDADVTAGAPNGGDHAAA